MTLLDWLIAKYPSAKRQTFKQMLTSGRLSINGKAPKSLRVLIDSDDRVVVSDRAAKNDLPRPKKLPFKIVFEDRDVLVIDKPSGLLTSTVASERRPTAWAAVQQYLAENEPPARPGLIHRLDRDASGLLVFSKNDAAYRHLKQQFLHHTVSRIYMAHLHGKLTPPSGRLESHLVERADGVVRSTKKPGKGQSAITEYETVSTQSDRSIVRLTLHTGRKHQIRVQLAEKGTPIVNDSVYGEKECEGQLMLTAVELAFDHPRTAQRMHFNLNSAARTARLMKVHRQ